MKTFALSIMASVAGVALATSAPALAAQPAATKADVDAIVDREWKDLDALYVDLHSHPELAFQEERSAALLAARMRKLGFTVTEHVGKTGVVAVYHNGTGPTVLVRTELDGLPIEEKTGLSYASRAQQKGEDGKPTFVTHACGHDNHMTWWIGTASALVAMKDRWQGTLVFIGQPAEEEVSGAKAMLKDGLFTRFPKPDYGFSAHVDPTLAGTVHVKQGPTTSAVDTILITFKGVGAHGSMPDKGIDPIVEGAHFVTDVQSVIARQKDPWKFGVVTVGSFHAGSVSNIIPDHADLQLTLRSYDPDVRRVMNDGVETTARAVAEMAHAPAPDIRHTFTASPIVNDPALAASSAALLKTALGADKVVLIPETAPGWTASEDYSELVNAGMTRSVYFSIGGYDQAAFDRFKAEGKPVPVNHSPFFAPTHDVAIRTGIETLTLAVLGVTAK
ncbi:M20 (carboxypeptidase Ss1) subfamily protein [Novosphingobium nitrogenifigens DSM 19370]|uniref:M20 (Carboxypeptidase Ss1) subfamily protein n=1 Tax=Novosphingobium nitrogenifigens DSM 19370 TaxID=983920 RepID=F1ZAR4_9SPHN|nr:amidohydrolase [Novosphingobium nitrogenifigens]EGD58299.1 M20 (carboxypeptidase Ss1) subfamily protein [Novosphingobium nitrogenifigens DSM 19370]